ncbi:NAC domain-containing protein 53 [Hibiscus syriacus]|uniref:NAC domain-containing protein 53 n=1 Tax=Hibiscus syriacus TaxID=106335 RepID=A0A6A2Y178_HIBSY|nr:NAC domain-containing protein 82-like [Hibiscus syriacus]KAE8673925.1 NAC domain-containing protein 53 [Hibiscus syriacus]
MGKNSLPPGFRFHPTDVELVMYYLKRKVMGKKISFSAIAEVDIYKYAPWGLPDLSCLKTGDLKWFFYCPVEKKGTRFNRATTDGYWKTTGRDRLVKQNREAVGSIKTLVFHRGKAPRGERTDWLIHEYRLKEKDDGYVLCVLFNKDGKGPKNGAQYGAPFKEDDWTDDDDSPSPVSVPEAADGGTSYFTDDLSADPTTSDCPQIPPVADAMVEEISCGDDEEFSLMVTSFVDDVNPSQYSL